MSILKGQKNEVWQNITSKIPSDGKDIIVNYKIKYKKLKRTEYESFMERHNGKNGNPKLEDGLPDMILDWKMPGPDGEDVPFSKENLIDGAFEESFYLMPISEGFINLHNMAYKEFKAKNS